MDGPTEWLTATAATIAIATGLVALYRQARAAFRRGVVDAVEDWQSGMLDPKRRRP